MSSRRTSKLKELIVFDNKQRYKNYPIIGIDEAGRGPLCGPVVAAAIVLPGIDRESLETLQYINDSKKFSGNESLREKIYDKLLETNCVYSIAEGSLEDIEKDNIYQTTFKTMYKAYLGVVEKLKAKEYKVLVDGHKKITYINDSIEQEAVIKGDSQSASIAAASILAKVYRDRIMKDLALEFPEYMWEKNKGYPTKDHIEAIRKHGRCKYHRMSYKIKGLDCDK